MTERRGCISYENNEICIREEKRERYPVKSQTYTHEI